MLKVFQNHFATYLQNIHKETFRNVEECKHHYEKLTKLLGVYDNFCKLTKLPVGEAIDKHHITTENQVFFIYIKYINQNNPDRSPQALWDRIGLGSAFAQKFKKNEDFWQNKESLSQIFDELVGINQKLNLQRKM